MSLETDDVKVLFLLSYVAEYILQFYFLIVIKRKVLHTHTHIHTCARVFCSKTNKIFLKSKNISLKDKTAVLTTLNKIMLDIKISSSNNSNNITKIKSK